MSRSTNIDDLPGQEQEEEVFVPQVQVQPPNITAKPDVEELLDQSRFGVPHLLNEESLLLALLFAVSSSNVLDAHLTNIPVVSGYLHSPLLKAGWKAVLFVIAFRLLSVYVVPKFRV